MGVRRRAPPGEWNRTGELTLTSALLPRWWRAVASGQAGDDLAATYTMP